MLSSYIAVRLRDLLRHEVPRVINVIGPTAGVPVV
jgi:hypothetical protein